MRSDLLFLALSALVGCTTSGGVDVNPDDTEDTEDTADTADSGDTGTDTADTDTGPFCGDGHVDAGEQCDLGNENGTAGDCSAQCDWNAWVTCDMLTGPFVTLDTTAPQPDGTFHVAGRFEGLVPLDSSCVADASNNVVVEFTVPAAGSWLVSTANAGTTADTSVSLRSDCDDRAELSCGAGNAPVDGASQAFLIDAEAGSSWVALVERIGGEGMGWHLSLTPIDGVAQAGQACDVDTPCGDGFACTDLGATDACVAVAAPVVTSATIEQVEYYDYRITVTGTDPNRDVVQALVPSFEDEYGDLWGDDDEESPLPIDGPTIEWSGDTFTMRWVQGVGFWQTGLGEIVELDVQVFDRAGGGSNVVTVVYPEPVESQTMPYVGDACDVSGFPRSCDPNPHADPEDAEVLIPGLVCTWNETNTATTCQDKNINPPPVMEGGSMAWVGPNATLTLSGYDTVERMSGGSTAGFTAHTTVVYTDATTVTLPDAFLSDCAFDHGDFTCSGPLVTTPIEKPVDHLEVWVEDQGYPSATTPTPVIVAWVDRVEPTVVGYNEACDLRGWEAVCEEPHVCSPTLSGIPACDDSEAPVLYEASGVYTGGWFSNMAFTFEGYDANADWGALAIEHPQYGVGTLTHDGFDSAWDPSPFGVQSYSGGTSANFGATWMYRVWLVDADGNTSNTHVVTGVPLLERGDDCNTGSCNMMGVCTAPEGYCDVEAGDTCSNRQDLAGTVKVCEIGVAPTLGELTVRRVDSKKYEVEFSGTDANGDAIRMAVVQDEDGVVTTPSVQLDFAAPLFGSTAFTSSFTGTIADPDATVTLDVTIHDYAFLGSNTVTVVVPPILHPDEECTGDDTVGTCWEGSECLSGACFAYEPQLSSATLTFKNNGRDGVVTVKGFDDVTGTSHQLKKLTVTLGGQTYEKTLSSSTPTWSGNEFTIVVDAPKAGTGLLVDEMFVSARIVDVGGFEDDGAWFITPHRGWEDTCSTAATPTDTCHAGLVCDEGVCANDPDPAKTCAGVPLVVATSDVVPFEFAASGTGLETYGAYATCGANNNPNGKEVAIAYEATQDGLLVITSASTDANAHPGYLFVRHGECVNYDAIVDCSNLTPNGSTVLGNEVSIPVLTGDVVYVTVDGPSWKKGNGTVTFTYE